VEENYGARFTYPADLVQRIAERCTEVDTGARNVDHILTKTLLPEMSAEFLSRLAEGATIQAVEVSIRQDGAFRYDIS
jgi:type VI secretion system protein VasG